MENTEVTNNENESINQVNDSTETPSAGKNKTNIEENNNNTSSIGNSPKVDKENTSTNNESSSNLVEKSSDATSSPKEPELVTRKSSRNLSKEERLKRQRELRKKRILESSHERLSRITKTYSQGSSFYDTEKDDNSLSRKSSSRSIHHHSIERSPSKNSINSINSPVLDNENNHIINEPENINIRDLSKDSSINSINSINNETINKNPENINNSVNENVEVKSKEPETTENTSINSSTEFNSNNYSNDNNNNNDNSNSKINNNDDSNDFARVLFREMLKEEFNKNNDSGFGNNPTFGNINNMNDLKNNMDSLLTSDKPFEALGKMFDFLGGDEKTTEEQRIAEEKYNQYCKLSAIIHTVVTILYSFIVVYVSIRAVDTNDIEITGKKSDLSAMGSFIYRLANMDTLSYGKSIFGMTPWTCLVLIEFTLLAGQISYQYAFNIKKETWKEFNLIPIPIINKAISLINQYKLYIEVLVNDLFLYLFIIGFSVSIGKLFY